MALDALTYAGTVTNLADVLDQVTFVEADIAAADLTGIDVVVNFAAESHNSLAVLDPTRFFRTNVLGTQALLEAARQAGVGALPPHLDVRGVRRPGPGRRRRRSPRSRRTGRARRTTRARRAATTPCARTTRRSACRSRSPTARTTTGRTSSRRRCCRCSPRVRWTASRCRSTRRRTTAASGSTCSTTAVAIEAVLLRGPGRRDLPRRHRRGGERRGDRRPRARRAGQAPSLKTIVPDRPGHDRRYLLDSTKIRRELGWEPRVPFDEGVARHDPLVRRQPRLVGTPARPQSRHRDGLDRLT